MRAVGNGPIGRALWTVALWSLFAGIATPRAAAQNDCGVDYSEIWRAVAQGSPSETHFFTRVTVTCEDGLQIYADSAIVTPPQRLSQFFGNVSFTEQGRVLLADRALYRNDIDRLDASGNVSLVDTTGSELEGDNLVYLRDGEDRANSHLTMTSLGGEQPRALIIPGERSTDDDAIGPLDSLVADSLLADSLSADTTAESQAQEPESIDISVVLAMVAWVLRVDSIPVASVPELAVPEPTPSAANSGADTVAELRVPTDEPPPQPPPDTASVQVDALPPSIPAPEVPAEPVDPYEVTADRIVIEGQDAFRGEGRVEVKRNDLNATGRNMVYDAGLGELVMVGDARSVGEGYELTAEAITVVLPDDQVEGIVARQNATLVTDDLDLTAPKIHIFVTEQVLQRLTAAPLGPDDPPVADASAPSSPDEGFTRATAVTQDFLLFGDSLDVITPDEELERVVAVGGARGESLAQDSINTEETPDVARRDWLEGDTIVATFVDAPTTPPTPAEPLPPAGDSLAEAADSTDALAGFQAVPDVAPDLATQQTGGTESSRYELDQLVALGNARSLYRMPPSDTLATAGDGRLALHYVVGEGITITMLDGEVEKMEVAGQTQGFHLEPVATVRPVTAVDSAAADAADTLAIDTLPVDTLPFDTLPFDTLPVDTLPVAPVPLDSLPPDTVGVAVRSPAGSETLQGMPDRSPRRGEAPRPEPTPELRPRRALW